MNLLPRVWWTFQLGNSTAQHKLNFGPALVQRHLPHVRKSKQVLPDNVSQFYMKLKTCVSLLSSSQNCEQVKNRCFVLCSPDCSKSLLTLLKCMSRKLSWSEAHVSLILCKSHDWFFYGKENKCFHPFWTTLYALPFKIKAWSQVRSPEVMHPIWIKRLKFYHNSQPDFALIIVKLSNLQK